MVVLPSSPVWYQSRGIDTSHNGVLAFGSRNLIYLLDLDLTKPRINGILGGHTDKVTSCSFCPNDQDQVLRLASGADDASVKIWDVQQKLMLQEHLAHGNNKIVSVHWSPVNPSLILSGDEKGFVVCWSLDSGNTDKFYPDGSSQMNLCSLTCSPHHDNIVAVGYKSGAVSLMDIKKNGTVIKKLRGHTNEVHGIIWSPHRDEGWLLPEKQKEIDNGNTDDLQSSFEGIIISSSKDKTIKLWSISKAKCIRTLRIPNRVTKGRKVNEDVARLYATVFWPDASKSRFLSSGYNGDVIVWDLDPDASSLFQILASQSHDSGHQRIIFNMSRGSGNANSIVSTSMDRQILHWTIPEQSPNTSPGPDWTLPTLGGFVYCIAVSPNDPSLVAIGVGDGMIRLWKTRSPTGTYDIATLWQGIKEKVMALAWHPVKEGCLAFATEDGKVGIYHTLSLRSPTIAETYHLKPVYALSWGPKCFSKAAEDREDINLERINLYSCGGDGVIYQHDPDKMSADAVNVDTILHSTNASKNCYSGKHSEVSWSHDGRLLAVGNDNGCVCLYTSPHLCHIIELKCHTKIVNCIRWRPPYDENDHRLEIATGSSNSTIFVHDLSKIFSDNEYTIGDEIEEHFTVSKPSKSLAGHLSRITGLSYNTRNPSEIVSSSYDSTAQVWNVESEKPLFNFRGHHGRLMCVVWTSVINESSMDETSGIIYTGADDYTVHGWYAKDQQHTEPVKKLPDFGFGLKSKFQSKKKGRQKKGPSQLLPPNGDIHPMPLTSSNGRLSPDLEALLEKKKIELLNSITGEAENPENTFERKCTPGKFSEQDADGSRFPRSISPDAHEVRSHSSSVAIDPARISSARQLHVCAPEAKILQYEEDLPGKRRKRLKNMFPQSVAMDNRKKVFQHQDCLKIVKWKMKETSDSFTEEFDFVPGEPKHINLGFYTDRRAAFRMMMNEASKLQGDDVTEGNYNIRMWMGDIIGTIKDATEKSQLSDQLVAMAPIAGQTFWRETAHAFAQQLLSEGHHLHAVHYLLVSDKVYEAIQVLLDGKHYREAVALARARLCDDDPVLTRTIKVWAKKLKSGGSVELAAKCYASIGDFEEAATSLAQRATSGVSNITDSDVASLWAAASIAKEAGRNKYSSGFANRALDTVCVRTWNWLENSDILSSFPNLAPYRFISMLHELLATRLVRRAGLSPPTTMKNSECHDAAPKMEGNEFSQCVLQSWRLLIQGYGGQVVPGLDTPSWSLICQEAIQRENDDVTESRLLLLLAFSLSGAFAAALKDTSQLYSVQTTNDTIGDIKETDEKVGWMHHLHKSSAILSGLPSIDPNVLKETFLVICEVVLWMSSRSAVSTSDSTKLNWEGNQMDKALPLLKGSSDGVGRSEASLRVVRQGCRLFLENLPHSYQELSQFYQRCFQLHHNVEFAGDG